MGTQVVYNLLRRLYRIISGLDVERVELTG